MTKQYDNTNRGALFRNDKKSEPTHADFNGTLNIEGKEYWLNMWENNGNGPVFRVTVKAKEPANNSKTGQYSASKNAQAPTQFDEEDSPF